MDERAKPIVRPIRMAA